MNYIVIYSGANPMPRELFTQLFEIMEYSFPRDERRDFEDHLNEFRNPRFHSLVHTQNGKIAGFMNYWQLTDFVYLEHFATARELRGQGLGSALMDVLRETVKHPIILEVEPPELSETAIRRIGFYNRLGFHLNEYEYYQPPYHEGEPPVPLMIMSSPAPLLKDEFNKVKMSLYREAYEISESFMTK